VTKSISSAVPPQSPGGATSDQADERAATHPAYVTAQTGSAPDVSASEDPWSIDKSSVQVFGKSPTALPKERGLSAPSHGLRSSQQAGADRRALKTSIIAKNEQAQLGATASAQRRRAVPKTVDPREVHLDDARVATASDVADSHDITVGSDRAGISAPTSRQRSLEAGPGIEAANVALSSAASTSLLSPISADTPVPIPKQLHFMWLGGAPGGAQRDYMTIWQKVNEGSGYQLNLWYDSDGLLAHHTTTVLHAAAADRLAKDYPNLSGDLKEDMLVDYAARMRSELSAEVKRTRSIGGNADDARVNWLSAHAGQSREALTALREKNRQSLQNIGSSGQIHLRDVRTELPGDPLFARFDQEMGSRGNMAAASDIGRVLVVDKFGGSYVDVDLLPKLNVPGVDLGKMSKSEQAGVFQMLMNANPQWLPSRDPSATDRSRHVTGLAPEVVAKVQAFIDKRPSLSDVFKPLPTIDIPKNDLLLGQFPEGLSNAFLAAQSGSPMLADVKQWMQRSYDRLDALDRTLQDQGLGYSDGPGVSRVIDKLIEPGLDDLSRIRLTAGLSDYHADGLRPHAMGTVYMTGPNAFHTIIDSGAGRFAPHSSAHNQWQKGLAAKDYFFYGTEEELKSSWALNANDRSSSATTPGVRYTGDVRFVPAGGRDTMELLQGIRDKKIYEGDLSAAERLRLADWFPASNADAERTSSWALAREAANDPSRLTQIEAAHAELAKQHLVDIRPGQLPAMERVARLREHQRQSVDFGSSLPDGATVHGHPTAIAIDSDSRKLHAGMALALDAGEGNLMDSLLRTHPNMDGDIGKSDAVDTPRALRQWGLQQELRRVGEVFDNIAPHARYTPTELADHLATMVQPGTVYIRTPQSTLSVVSHIGAGGGRIYGLYDPSIGEIDGITHKNAFADFLNQHLRNASGADGKLDVVELDRSSKDAMRAKVDTLTNYVTSTDPRNLLTIKDERDGALRIGDTQVRRATLHDMGAMIDGRPIAVDSVRDLAGGQAGRLQFDAASLERAMRTGGAGPYTDVLYEIASERKSDTPLIRKNSQLPAAAARLADGFNVVLGQTSRIAQRLASAVKTGGENVVRYIVPGASSKVVSHSAIGLQAFGAYTGLKTLVNAIEAGDSSEAALAAAGLVSNTGAMALEAGAATLAKRMQAADLATSAGFGLTRMGGLSNNVIRGASVGSLLLTLPFDVAGAYNSFSAAGASSGGAQQDHHVQGAIQAASAVASVATTIAGLQGVAAAGPIGVAIGLGLLAGSGIYSSKRYLDELGRYTTLSDSEKLSIGLSRFFASVVSENFDHTDQQVLDRVTVAKTKPLAQLQSKLSMAGFLASHGGTFSEGVHGDRRITPQPPRWTGEWKEHPFVSIIDATSGGVGVHKTQVMRPQPPLVEDANDRMGSLYPARVAAQTVKNPGASGDAVFWSTGGGNDSVVGYQNRENHFLLGQGSKFITGGDRADVFVSDGAGDHRVVGGKGLDTYHVQRKAGHVVVRDEPEEHSRFVLDFNLDDIRMRVHDGNLDIGLGPDGRTKITVEGIYRRDGDVNILTQTGGLSFTTNDGYIVAPVLPSRLSVGDDGRVDIEAMAMTPRVESATKPSVANASEEQASVIGLAQAMANKGLDGLKEQALDLGILAPKAIPRWHPDNANLSEEALREKLEVFQKRTGLSKMTDAEAAAKLGLDESIVGLIRKIFAE
jgi:hypothetical protein